MDRLAALGTVLAFVSVCHTSPQNSDTIVVSGGSIGVGLISGGNFAAGSFGTDVSSSSRPEQTNVYVSEDGKNVVIQGSNSGNTQLYPVKPQTTLFHAEQGGLPSQGENGRGSIVIGAVVRPNHDNNKGNTVNKLPAALDSSAIEAIFGNNNGHKNGVNISAQGSIGVGVITGGNFAGGILGPNNKAPTANVNDANIVHHSTVSEAPHSASTSVIGNAGMGNNHGQSSTGNNAYENDKPWIWNR